MHQFRVANIISPESVRQCGLLQIVGGTIDFIRMPWVNPLGLEMLPSPYLRPALWEVTLQFSANQPMTCQFLVRVRDEDNRLWEDGDAEFVPTPATYMPVIAKP